ncbi:SUF system NifU family Fe-S cluster assembly protein [Leuconostoc carnosum]|uniref:Fe-S cluster assembly sulfur transfer protein SufU n=1 Tax=Leuconostoc carnosum TaxID=1252 RepID=UPI001239D8C3|nr:SUF system NifU family Fe-S cluster assembly protein [Leuconostoc carnosum]KAA8370358.1 SUF system NifU family Fe-S cluster assembly protein [Leuconostoc carnosum]KAA8382005.1 SUF system NifU family Fe-S cluster assembly protein [Leuconostoc carnosum]
MSLHNLDNLYRQSVMAYAKHPRHYRPVATTDRNQATKYNPTCGDTITVSVELSGDLVTDIHFYGDGCAISKASASMMTDLVIGKDKAEIQQLMDNFLKMTMGEQVDTDTLGEAQLLAGVTKFPTRIKCATLPWHTLQALLFSKEEAK